MLTTEELLAEAAQSLRLSKVLPEVLRRVPLYRGLVSRLCPGQSPLMGLPFMTKAELRRDFPANFLGSGADLEQLLEEEVLELEHTSGTSEPRTALLLPPGWWAEQERRALFLNTLTAGVFARCPEPRRVNISSPVCSSDVCFTGVPSRSERVVGSTLFLSLSRYPFLWDNGDLARMAAEALEWQPEFLDVDPVYGVIFALYCERHGIRFPSLKFVLCSYEFVSVIHRRILQRVFKVPVFNLYGSTETGHLLMEDESGEMRSSLETAFLEVTEEPGAPVLSSRDPAPQAFGELVVTTLSNELMPLVRYRIGDLVECRRAPYRTRYLVHGRVADAFVRPSGKRVTTWQVDQCFSDITGIAHYQLIERAGGPWLLRFVVDGAGPGQRALLALGENIRTLLELSESPSLDSSDKLLAENSGKFRLGYPVGASGGKARM